MDHLVARDSDLIFHIGDEEILVELMDVRHVPQISSLLHLPLCTVVRLCPAPGAVGLVALWAEHLIAAASILDCDVLILLFVRLLVVDSSLLLDGVVVAHPDDALFLLVENVSQIGAQLLDLLLLLHDLVL